MPCRNSRNEVERTRSPSRTRTTPVTSLPMADPNSCELFMPFKPSASPNLSRLPILLMSAHQPLAPPSLTIPTIIVMNATQNTSDLS